MKTYTVEIKRGTDLIFSRQITADDAIEMMRPTACTITGGPASPDEVTVVSQYKDRKPVVTRGGKVVKAAKPIKRSGWTSRGSRR